MTDLRSESVTPLYPHPKPAFEPHPEAGAIELADRRAAFWKGGAVVLGIGLVLAISSQISPSSAMASGGGQDDLGTLTVGGFIAVEGEPGLVLVDGDGVRVGVLLMKDSEAAVD